jgi:hypothetical protein
MRLYATVVKADIEEYTSKQGVPTKAYKLYLAPGDPVEGAMETSVTADLFAQVKKGDNVSFTPSFAIRNRFGSPTIAVRVLEDFKVEGSK